MAGTRAGRCLRAPYDAITGPLRWMKGHMKVKQLKELLVSVPDEAEVVVPAQDHEYRRAHAINKTTALFQGSTINEDHGEDSTPESEFGKRQIVLVVA